MTHPTPLEILLVPDVHHRGTPTGHGASATFSRAAVDKIIAAVRSEAAGIPAAQNPPNEQVRDEGFSAGTVASLACVLAQDQEVLWKEIVVANGRDQLFDHALKSDGDWAWAGFEQYAERSFGKEFVKEAKRKAAQQKAPPQ